MISYEGIQYRTSELWYNIIPLTAGPINYLEVGTFYGANLLSVASSYAAHPESRLFCIDPWIDYENYPEYKGEIVSVYPAFLRNLEKSGYKDKTTVMRGFSNTEIPKFEDNFFDIIYIDGNHEPEYVLEDAVLAFRKLKIGGYLVFDDYHEVGHFNDTKRGIDAFISGYYKRISDTPKFGNGQMFVRKTS
jgi:predicted O-methyltransferase YrrM